MTRPFQVQCQQPHQDFIIAQVWRPSIRRNYGPLAYRLVNYVIMFSYLHLREVITLWIANRLRHAGLSLQEMGQMAPETSGLNADQRPLGAMPRAWPDATRKKIPSAQRLPPHIE